MGRLLTLEWLKLKRYRAFWVISILYFGLLGMVCSSGKVLLDYIAETGGEIQGVNPGILPIYDFPDLWQNLTFVAMWMKPLLAFIVILSLTNEYSYKTFRQNVIDGLSKNEFLLSKLLFIGVLSLINMLFILVLGLIIGFVYSPVTDVESVLSLLPFVTAYFLNVLTYLVFAFLFGLLIRRSGFAIVLLFVYSIFLEPITGLILELNNIPVQHYLPLEVINSLIANPFPKFLFREIQDYVAVGDVLMVLLYLAVLLGIIFRMVNRRDVL